MKKTIIIFATILVPIILFGQAGVYELTNKSYSSGANSRPTITVEVIDDLGNPISNATVYFCNNLECQNQTTNAKGLAFFSAYETPTFMYAFKSNKGLASARINQSRAVYNLILPPVPLTNLQAGDQINSFLNVASTAYGYFDDGLFVQSALEAISKGVSGVALPSLGVPGVFSINPIPVIGADGKLGLKISGRLFDEILQLWRITNPYYKNRVYFEYLPAY